MNKNKLLKLITILMISFPFLSISYAEDMGCKERILEHRKKSEFSKAVDVAKECCKKGDAYSCNQVGFFIEMLNVKDEKKPIFYFEKSCEFGYSGGCKNIASNYKRMGNQKKAKVYYEKACALKDPASCVELMLLD